MTLGIYENCGRCGRKLKTDKSRQIGYGPTCKRMVDEAEARLQMTLADMGIDQEEMIQEAINS